MGIAFGPEGDLYVCDNQNWPTGTEIKARSTTADSAIACRRRDIVKTTVVAQRISHPNGVRVRDGKLYVTVSMLPQVTRTDGLLTSAVYVFPTDGHDSPSPTRWTTHNS